MTTIASNRVALRPGTEESVFIGRSIRHSIRNVDALLMAIFLPIMLMFTFVFGGAISPDGGYVNYVVPGIIERFRTMPIRSWAVLTGHVVASLVRNLFATAVVIGVGLLLGFRPDATPLEWLAVIGVIALYILAITYLFAAIGLAARSTVANGFGLILLFLPYVSSAFVPVYSMPAWLQWIADNQPITPVIETIRGLLTGAELGASPWLALGWCALILLIAIVWVAVIFRRKAGRR